MLLILVDFMSLNLRENKKPISYVKNKRCRNDEIKYNPTAHNKHKVQVF